MKNIMVATDLSVNCSRALDRAISLAKQHNCTLHILHVMAEYFIPKNWNGNFVDGAKAKTLIQSQVDSHSGADGLDIKITIRAGDAFSAILSFSLEIDADLIVMGLHKKTSEGLRDLFVGTTIERTIRRGIKPVLMVKDKPTGNYTKVLVPTDFSVAAQSAFDLAVELEPRAKFDVLHVYEVPFAGFITDSYAHTEIWQEAQAKLDFFLNKALDKIEAVNKSVKVEKTLLRGAHYSGIMKAVIKEKPDLIAMGTNGRSGIAHAVFGSLAKDILANPPCDVLVSGGL